jgi:hypothetical protein
MKTLSLKIASSILASSFLALMIGLINLPTTVFASGSSGSGGSGGGGGGSSADSIKVSKCYYASTGQLLIKASSSDTTAHLYVYLPSGAYLCEVQNGGGSRYGGTVTPYIGFDPGSVTIKSSSGGSITVLTAPFQI